MELQVEQRLGMVVRCLMSNIKVVKFLWNKDILTDKMVLSLCVVFVVSFSSIVVSSLFLVNAVCECYGLYHGVIIFVPQCLYVVLLLAFAFNGT